MSRNHVTNNRLTILVMAIVVIALCFAVWLAVAKPYQPTNKSVWRSSAAVIGSDSASVKIVEFGDFQCPACKQMAPILRSIVDSNHNNVALQYRYFPLPEHVNAFEAAVAAEYAFRQNVFWQFHDFLYTNQDSWANSADAKNAFTRFFVLLGVDERPYQSGQDRAVAEAIVIGDMQAAADMGLSGTPSLLINGTLYAGQLSQVSIQHAIDSISKP